MNGANHAMSGLSTYPFNIFGGGWEAGLDHNDWAKENRGDTVVEHDVWMGTDVTVMPGVRIGRDLDALRRADVAKLEAAR